MIKGIDCFLPYIDKETTGHIIEQLRQERLIHKIYVIAPEVIDIADMGCTVSYNSSLNSSACFRQIADQAETDYILIMLPRRVDFGYKAIERMYNVARNIAASMVYADHFTERDGKIISAPVNDLTYGSIRDDFDFGSVLLISAQHLREAVSESGENHWQYAGWYEIQLAFTRKKRIAPVFHIRESLYCDREADLRKSGEKQFDYVNPRNRDSQIEAEKVCTEHLKRIGAYIAPESISLVNIERAEFETEASVIIPVRNRVKTIADAVKSALAQQTSFPYNVIVIDNHSTDGTSEALDRLAAADARCIVIRPERNDLGIGGCWSVAINDPRCGRFAVQLDSDDLYSSTATLQRIVDKFYEEKCAMVIGSYTMCNFDLKLLPPGLINHHEWTEENGRNNALRINGLGAPRAFFTPLLRKIGIPNTSYGEDYALGLAFSRKYKIGRIYDELYLCRRWEGNSDAALSPEQLNRNNMYKDNLRTMEIIDRRNLNQYWNTEVNPKDVSEFFRQQLQIWPLAAQNYQKLASVVQTELIEGNVRMSVQWNPARISSTGAKIDPKSISQRPCFLCEVNRPEEQMDYPIAGRYQILVNPYPILPVHFTIPMRYHTPQAIRDNYIDMMRITQGLNDMLVFYNGPKCGASAPDHMHFQAGSRGIVPLERDWTELYRFNRSRIYPITEEEYIEASHLESLSDSLGIYSLKGYLCPGFIIISRTPEANAAMFRKLYDAMPAEEDGTEPMMNILSWMMSSSVNNKPNIVSIVFPRSKHRPDSYFKEGEERVMVSPGALDMAGLIITPREEDYRKLTPQMAADIIRECSHTLDSELEIILKIKGGGKF
jgi:glycosyltransferase involved in cell wall biosynthesis